MKKLFSKRTKITIALLALLAIPVVALGGSSKAIGEGTIEQGDFYYSRNLTTGSSLGDPTAANKCDTLQYKVRMHNPGASPVTNVHVKVNLPGGASTQNVSTATITAENAFPASVSDTATVKISSSQSISYISGSTQLLNSSNSVISNLPDGIVGTGSGVSIGSVGVSVNEVRYVQFKAKVSCPETPPCEQNPNLPECNPCKDHPQKPECNPCKEHPNLPGCNPTCKEKPNMPECQPCKNNPERPECQPCSQNPNLPQCKPPCQDDQKDTAECTPPETPGMGGGSTTPTGSEGVSELVNTGPGQMAALFTVASTAGTIGYRLFIGRKLGLSS